MTLQTILFLVAIGLLAGAMSGFVGIGGGVIIVPGLIYLLGMTQHSAMGTSLLLMLPPIGILAVMNYWKAGEMNWRYAVVIAVAFIIGGYFGSKVALKLSPALVKVIFGILMLYISVKMIYSGYKGGGFNKDATTNTTTVDSNS